MDEEEYDDFWKLWARSKLLETGFVNYIYGRDEHVRDFKMFCRARNFSVHSYFAFGTYMSELHRIWRMDNR